MVKKAAVNFTSCEGEEVYIIPSEVCAVEGERNLGVGHLVTRIYLKSGATVAVEAEPGEVIKDMGLG